MTPLASAAAWLLFLTACVLPQTRTQSDCMCVRYYQCNSTVTGDVYFDEGQGLLIDIRWGERLSNWPCRDRGGVPQFCCRPDRVHPDAKRPARPLASLNRIPINSQQLASLFPESMGRQDSTTLRPNTLRPNPLTPDTLRPSTSALPNLSDLLSTTTSRPSRNISDETPGTFGQQGTVSLESVPDGQDPSASQFPSTQPSGSQTGSQQGFNQPQGSQGSQTGLQGSQQGFNQPQGSQGSQSGFQGSQQGFNQPQGSQGSQSGFQGSQQGFNQPQGSQGSQSGFQGSQQGFNQPQGSQGSQSGFQGSQQGFNRPQGPQGSQSGFQGSQQGFNQPQGPQGSQSGLQGSQQGFNQPQGSQSGFQGSQSGSARRCGRPVGLGVRLQGGQGDEIPWFVQVWRPGQRSPACGGSLLLENVVLTGAHCLASPGERLTVTSADGQQRATVVRTIVHPDYGRGNLHNDVALLFLSSPVGTSTVCLPPEVALQHVGPHTCFATGYGSGGRVESVEVPLVARETCERLLRETRLGQHFRLHHSFLCAGGENGRDTCKGDGGSPLLCRVGTGEDVAVTQVGLVAWGIGCGDPVPGVYASTAAALQWIDREVMAAGLDPRTYRMNPEP